MTKFLARVGRYTFLVLLTAVAVVVMWWVSQKAGSTDPFAEGPDIAPAPLGAQPRTLVKAMAVEPAMRDVTIRYSGKIEPWEYYSLGFEVGGRVESLGEDASGKPLDDGDRVEAGQLLARLDDRVLRAQLAEATANLELATTDLSRSQRIRERTPGAVSESEYQAEIAARAQAIAAKQVAEKQLDDTIVTSPISGKISQRMVEAGESVNPNETVFEIVQDDRLRLVINIPEARIRELEMRRREVQAAQQQGRDAEDPESGIFRTHIRLEGGDMYGNPWPTLEEEVYRIAATADPVTGLFEVEIQIDNESGLLRPGMVATADIVTDRILAYEVPEAAVLFRPESAYTFTVDEEPTALPVMFWEVGETEIERARKVVLNRFIDQGEKILIPAAEADLTKVVTRGQQRLRDGQLVRTIREPLTESQSAIANQR